MDIRSVKECGWFQVEVKNGLQELCFWDEKSIFKEKDGGSHPCSLDTMYLFGRLCHRRQNGGGGAFAYEESIMGWLFGENVR